MNDETTPSVMIGGRKFLVPEFTIREQRRVTPMLSRLLKKMGDIDSDEMWAEMMDAIFFCLTITTTDGKADGPKVNDISKDEFESLKVKSMDMATTVMPVLLIAAGLQPAKATAEGGAGAAEPGTPLSGETTSTTESQT